MSSYSGWSTFEKVKIVYRNDTSKIPSAYIVDPSNKKSFENAIKCAGDGYTIVETTNDDFTFSLYNSAGGSSQGGRLSFWMCLVKKKDVPDFLVGISTDLLINVLKESTFINGQCTEKVVFARNYGQLGVLHKNMAEYNDMINDIALKATVNTKKTKKWKVGYSYKTLTTEDTLFGYFSDLFDYSYDYYKHKGTIELTPNKLKMPIISYKTLDDLMDKMFSYYFDNPCYSSTSLPARQENKKEYDEEQIITTMIDTTRKFFNDFKFNDAGNIIGYIHSICLFYNIRPEFTKDMLNLLKSYAEEDIMNINNNKTPYRFGEQDPNNNSCLRNYRIDNKINHQIIKDNKLVATVTNYLDLINFFIDYVNNL